MRKILLARVDENKIDQFICDNRKIAQFCLSTRGNKNGHITNCPIEISRVDGALTVCFLALFEYISLFYFIFCCRFKAVKYGMLNMSFSFYYYMAFILLSFNDLALCFKIVVFYLFFTLVNSVIFFDILYSLYLYLQNLWKIQR